jgi:hypothetical protein
MTESPLDQEFYASIKLVTGEEIFCIVFVDDENPDDPILALQDPVIFTCKSFQGHFSIKVEPWIKMSNDGIYFIRLSRVVWMSEVNDLEIIGLYKNFIEEKEQYLSGENDNEKEISEKMGYLGSVEQMKNSLEDMYKLDTNESFD